MEAALISPDRIDEVLGDEPTPYYLGGQQILILRDLDCPENLTVDTYKIILHLIREAYQVGILVYDKRGCWSLNSNFGDVEAWIPRRNEIADLIRDISTFPYP